MTDSARHGPEIGRFGDSLSAVGAALDEFARFDRPDPVSRRDEWTARLNRDLPRDGLEIDDVLAELLEVVVPNGDRIPEPGFWGFITTGPTTMSVSAASAALLAAPQRYGITAFNLVEELSLRWLGELCGLGPHMLGVYSSGGSVANLVALGAARQWSWEQVGVDPARHGVGGQRVAVYASEEVHHTIQRSCAVLGIGREAVRRIAVDRDQQMVPASLEAAMAVDRAADVLPLAVVASAGTTNTGAIDPMRAIGEVAKAAGTWFHVDGAYGLPGILDPRVRERYDGLELADSAIVDPHKWLSAPVGIGATFVRDRSILHRAFTQEPADYLEGAMDSAEDIVSSLDEIGIPYYDFGVELSAPPRGVQVWSIILEEGLRGLQQRVMRDNDFARLVADFAREHPRLESLTEPQLSIACIRYVPAALPVDDLDVFNAALLRRLIHETRFLPSSTVVNDCYAIRPCFINPRTTSDDVEEFLTTLVDLGDRMVADLP